MFSLTHRQSSRERSVERSDMTVGLFVIRRPCIYQLSFNIRLSTLLPRREYLRENNFARDFICACTSRPIASSQPGHLISPDVADVARFRAECRGMFRHRKSMEFNHKSVDLWPHGKYRTANDVTDIIHKKCLTFEARGDHEGECVEETR